LAADLFYRSRLFVYSIITATGSALGFSGAPLLPCIIFPLAVGLAAMLALLKSNRNYLPIISCLLFLYAGLAFGVARASAWQGRGGPQGKVMLEGRVEVGCRGDQDDIIGLFRVERVIEGGGSRHGDTYLLRAGGKAGEYEWGDSLRVDGNLFLFDRVGGGVGGSLTATEMTVAGKSRNPLLRLAVSYRNNIRRQLERNVDPDVAGLIEGMVLGDYRLLSGRDLRAFRLSGLIHLCAASGLNVAILAAFILWIGRRLRFSRRNILLIQVPLLTAYALAVGLSVPIMRATVVALIAVAAYFTGRDFDFIAAMGAAAFYLVWSDPGAATGVSFQLCFASALGTVMLYRPIARLLGPDTSKVVALLAATLAAQMAVAPLLLFHFGEVSLLAPISNLLALPLVAPVMALAMLSSLLWIFGFPLAGLIMTAAAFPTRMILLIARTIAAPGWSALRIFPFSPLWMLVFYPALAAAFLSSKKWKTAGRYILVLLIVAAIFSGAVIPSRAGIPHGEVRISFLDVGQGDATLIQSGKTCVLIDGGPDENILSTQLRAHGLRYLDAVVISHPESDHIGGLPAALDGCKVGLLLHPGTRNGGLIGKLLAQAEEMGVAYRIMRGGDELQVGDIHLKALAPPQDIPTDGATNEYSLVLKADIRGTTLLFPGDVEEVGQEALLQEPELLNADILKVPHHGGFASTGEEFFAAARSSIAVISVGEDNSYGHPSNRTLDGLARCGSKTYRTDLDGDVVIESEARGFKVTCAKSPMGG
jgi:competence protein ComEC